jgi:hypothetical protein
MRRTRKSLSRSAAVPGKPAIPRSTRLPFFPAAFVEKRRFDVGRTVKFASRIAAAFADLDRLSSFWETPPQVRSAGRRTAAEIADSRRRRNAIKHLSPSARRRAEKREAEGKTITWRARQERREVPPEGLLRLERWPAALRHPRLHEEVPRHLAPPPRQEDHVFLRDGKHLYIRVQGVAPVLHRKEGTFALVDLKTAFQISAHSETSDRVSLPVLVIRPKVRRHPRVSDTDLAVRPGLRRTFQ